MNQYCLPLGLAITLCAACSQSEEQANTAYPASTVGVSMSATETNAFFKDMYQSFEQAGKEQPALKLLLQQANNDQNLQHQQLDDMIAQGAKALVVNLVDVSAGQEFVNKYCAKGIPVVYINRNPGDKNLADCHNSYFVDGDAALAGVIQGLQVLKHWKTNPQWDKNQDGVIAYALLEGIPNHAGAMARTKWSVGTMQNYPALGLPVQKIFQETALFRRDKAAEVVENWIQSPEFNQIEILLANNDNMAIGAIDALKKHNISLPVFGIDGGAIGKDMVRAGEMVATVFNDYDNQARTALRLAANLAAGEEAMKGIDYRMEYKVINVPYQDPEAGK